MMQNDVYDLIGPCPAKSLSSVVSRNEYALLFSLYVSCLVWFAGFCLLLFFG